MHVLNVVVDGSVNMCNATPVTSRCDTVLGLCDRATRLQVTDKPCDKCNLRYFISAEYPKVRLSLLSLVLVIALDLSPLPLVLRDLSLNDIIYYLYTAVSCSLASKTVGRHYLGYGLHAGLLYGRSQYLLGNYCQQFGK